MEPKNPNRASNEQIENLKLALVQRLQNYPELANVKPQLLLDHVATHNPSLHVFKEWTFNRLANRIGSFGKLREIVYGQDRSRSQIIYSIVEEIISSDKSLCADQLTLDYVYNAAQRLYPNLGWSFVSKSQFSCCANLARWREFLQLRQLAPALQPPRQHDSEVNNTDVFLIFL